jgi:hypothetical protein
MRHPCRIAMCVMAMLAAVNFMSAQTPHAARSAVTTKDGKTIITAPSGANTSYVDENAGMKAIFSNLATEYPKGLYWCCEGATISGPKSPPLFIEWWHAAAFTPTADATVKKIVVSIGYLSGNVTSVILSLNADNAGIPGDELVQWTVNDLGDAGTCCTVQTKSSSGVPVTAGQQYWIVVSTGPDSDVNASWNVADNNQIDNFLNAGLTSQNSDGWVSSPTSPNVVFAVLGQ